MSPSLSLDFEQSPPDQPMFVLNMNHRSISGSSLEVQHSSPMTVPRSARQTNPYRMLPSTTDLPAGTVPNTPGPLQRAFDRDPANQLPWQYASPTPLERQVPSAPVLTPLPGTNLSHEDFSAALVALPPSVTSLQIECPSPGYFSIPLNGQVPVENADVLNGMACLKLAADHDDAASSEFEGLDDYSDSQGFCHGSDKVMAREYEGTTLQNTINTDDVPPRGTRTLRRKHQAEDLYGSVHTINFPQHHQALPLRLKQQHEDVQDRARKDSVSSEYWYTSVSTMSENGHETGMPSQSDRTDIPASYPSPAENTWGHHMGLYDGTGYGDDATLPATPCEPDEGTRDVLSHFDCPSSKTSPLFSVDGIRSEEGIFAPSHRCEVPYAEHA